jgi:hypothetical protein
MASGWRSSPRTTAAAGKGVSGSASHLSLSAASAADTPPYRWEFTEDGRDFSVAVRARVLSTEIWNIVNYLLSLHRD